MQLVHGGIWGHMAFGVTWRFSHPFAKVCPRSPPSAVRGGVLMVNVLNASKTFTQRKMFAVFFLMVLESYRACVFMPGNGLPCCHCGRLGAAAPSY